LNDARGSRISVEESSFSITHGIVSPQSTTSRGLSIALADNVAEVMIRKGSPLPAKGTQIFKTAHDVIAGDPKSILRTYVLEGDCARSDRNIAIGSIELRGTDLHRTLRAGEDAEIRYELDESKILSAEAFFPAVNETCVMVRIPERPRLLPGEIDQEVRIANDRLAPIKRAAPENVDPLIDQQILLIEREKQAAAEDADAQQKAAQQVLEIKVLIDAMEKSSEWELLAVELDNFRRRARKLSQASGTQEQVRDIEESIRAAEGALARKDLATLRTATEKLKAAYWEINFARDEYWKEQFAWLKEEADFVDSSRAESLKEEGARALRRSDIGSLRSIVWDLWGLLPTWQQSKLDKQYDAGLLSTH
jgi:molecular chaperone DnaK